MIDNFFKTPSNWTVRIPESEQFPRNWVTTCDISLRLSNNERLIIKEGTVWDGASVPKWLWWLFKPIDEGAIGDLIHDELWRQKDIQLPLFDYDIHEARKFADRERVIWRNLYAPKKKIKTNITNFVIRLIGGFFYSKQLQIPN